MIMRDGGADRTYPFVRAWQQFLGNGDPAAEAQVKRARAAGAPPDAIYQVHGTNEWATVGSIRSAILRRQVVEAAEVIAGRRLRPRPARPRCDALVRRGTGPSTCDRVLDTRGQCDRASDHITGGRW